MRLLVLGYGSIVRRRVLPAARSVAAFDAISVASRSQGAAAPEPGVTWFADYEDALASSGADVVYVSGVNSEHEQWIRRTLARGCHAIVDKPALPDRRSTEAMVAEARRRRLGLGEATVFTFHPQVARLKSLVADAPPESVRAYATFSVPPLPAGDFRYRAECGGGSLFDLGPYAVATNRVLFGAAPADVSCRVLTSTGSGGVDTSFSVLMTHDSGGAIAGHFGFTTSYQNRVSVLTAARTVDVDRIFTSPPDAPAALRVRDASGESVVTAPAADAFAGFLEAFARAVERSEFEPFETAMLADAALLERLRQAALS